VETEPVVFIRYNPNRIVKVNGDTIDIPRVQREKKLMQLLKDIESGAIKFTETLNIVYLF
jgi:hypothetical protein